MVVRLLFFLLSLAFVASAQCTLTLWTAQNIPNTGVYGPANQARFISTWLERASDGTIIFTDEFAIARLTTTGMVEAVVGNGRAGFTPDGGPATSSIIPGAIALDRHGSPLWMEAIGDRAIVRTLDADGRIRTIAGQNAGSGWEGWSGRADRLWLARGSRLASTPTGDLYVLDTETRAIWKISPDGAFSNVYRGDGPPEFLNNLRVAPDGQLYVRNNFSIYRLTAGRLAPYAGVLSGVSAGDGVAARDAYLGNPDFNFDQDGTMLINSSFGSVHRVLADGTLRRLSGLNTGSGRFVVEPGGSIVQGGSVLSRFRAGQNTEQIAGVRDSWTIRDNTPVADVQFSGSNMAFAADGSAYVAVSPGIVYSIRNGVVRRFAGGGTFDSALNIPATDFRFRESIYALAVEPSGSLLVNAGPLFRIGTDGVIREFPSRIPGGLRIGVFPPVVDSTSGDFVFFPTAGSVQWGQYRARTDDVAYYPMPFHEFPRAAAGNGRKAWIYSFKRTSDPPYSGNVVSEFDLSTPGSRREILDWPSYSLAAAPDDSLWTVDPGSQAIWRYDTRTGKWTRKWLGEWFLTRIDPAARRWVSSRTPNTVTRQGDLILNREWVIRGIDDCPAVPQPRLNPAGVVNAASFAPVTEVAPGQMITIFGEELGPESGYFPAFRTEGYLRTETPDGVRILYANTQLPLLYAGPNQISVVVPFRKQAPYDQEKVTDLILQVGGMSVQRIPVRDTPTQPGLFTANASGQGPGAFLNQDLSANSASNPARSGDVLILYATGLGAMTPDQDGGIANSTSARPLAPVAVRIGGRDAIVEYAGNAPGLITGFVQINVRIPQGLTGEQPVELIAGGVSTTPTQRVTAFLR